ncbi:MAG: heparan-alpha-glucosaminide N-acetyltransferase domain-containing protein [Terracidiphilus sp.]
MATVPTPAEVTTKAPAAPLTKRLLSLDVVRGITIAFMIMVNNNGGPGSWGFMNHARWNGLTPTDLVFPTFVFVVGVSVVFAFEARLARGATRAELARHTVQRTVVLILCGILVNSFPFFEFAHMRFFGVLQRIAICYLAVGLFYLVDNRASSKVVALAGCLVGYWALLRWAPIPGVGVPGRDVPFMDMTQNLVSWIDRHLFPYHLYLYAPAHNVRDPEGLLSDLPAIGTALMGVLAGLWLRSRKSIAAKAVGLAVASLVSLAVGYLWSIEFPLNKNMWTSSFVLVAGGYSLALLTLCFWAIERQGWRKGWTWVWLVFGSNAIAVYMFSELMPGVLDNVHVSNGSGGHMILNEWIFRSVFAHIPNPHWAAFAYSVSFTAFCFLPVWVLYRKKIFIKV